MPRAGRWDEAGIPARAAIWLEPTLGAASRGGPPLRRSLTDPGEPGWEVPALYERDGALFVRIFNVGGGDTAQELGVGFEADKIEVAEPDGWRSRDETGWVFGGADRRPPSDVMGEEGLEPPASSV